MSIKMQKPITYLSSKVLLEHLEPNLRFHLSLCCPAINKADKLAPSKIAYLGISDRTVTVNSNEYYFENPWAFGEPNPEKLLISIFGIQKIKVISVKCLDIQHFLVDIPLGMKFKIQELKLYGNMTTHFEAVRDCIHEASYPLRHLKMCVFGVPEYEDHEQFVHPVLQSAQNLEICDMMSRRQFPLDYLLMHLENAEIFLDNGVTGRPEELIVSWMYYSRPVGSTLLLGYGRKDLVEGLMRSMKLSFNLASEPNGTLIHLLTNDTTIEISTGQREDEYRGTRYIVRMEVVPLKP